MASITMIGAEASPAGQVFAAWRCSVCKALIAEVDRAAHKATHLGTAPDDTFFDYLGRLALLR